MIEFGIPEGGNTRLLIYNILGEEVMELVNQDLMPGYYQFRWNGKDKYGHQLPSGIYLYRITADNFTDVKKMMLLK